MGHKSNFEKAVYFTKCSVSLACFWPPSRTASKWEIVKFNICWFISLTSALCILIPMIFSIYVYRNDTLMLVQAVCQCGGYLNLFLKLFIFRIYRKRTQIQIDEMEEFLINLQPREQIILQRYLDRCAPLHIFITLVTYTGIMFLVVGPMIVPDQLFPTTAAYPFRIDSGITMYLVYIHQCLGSFQAASGVCADNQSALILWFAGARLEILAEDLTDLTDPNQFQYFVQKHKKLMHYAFEASDTMSYIAFVSCTSVAISTVTSALQLLSDQPVNDKITYGLSLIICTITMFISAWPADNLINACDSLANAVYDTSWIDMSPRMMRNVHIVLQRCQRPIVVSVAGFMPTLSLRSYASFVSCLFSYFTTLRVFMVTEN